MNEILTFIVLTALTQYKSEDEIKLQKERSMIE